MADHGTFYWNELMTRDAEKAKAFYAETLGWTFDAMAMPEGGTYWLAKAGDALAGGILTMDGPQFEGVPEHWFAYIAVDDVDAVSAGRKRRAPRSCARSSKCPASAASSS